MADQIKAWFDTAEAHIQVQPNAPTGKDFIGVSHNGELLLIGLCTADGQMLTCGLSRAGWNNLMMAAGKHIMAIGGGGLIYDAEATTPPTMN